MSDSFSRIFLLSHMRAFTSLAGHILGSHPQINGYYEMHVSYDTAQSLAQQLALYRQSDTLKPNSRYLFDKLLHNDYALALESLALTDTRIFVALRRPEQTLKSIVNLFAQKPEEDLYASPEEAARYYIDRLNWLSGFCSRFPDGYFYFDAEMLQGAPDVLLPKLSAWLTLDTPLSKHYALFSQTGQARKGDTSENIRRGSITSAQVDYTSIHIPDAVLQQAQAAYLNCRQAITRGAAKSVML